MESERPRTMKRDKFLFLFIGIIIFASLIGVGYYSGAFDKLLKRKENISLGFESQRNDSTHPRESGNRTKLVQCHGNACTWSPHLNTLHERIKSMHPDFKQEEKYPFMLEHREHERSSKYFREVQKPMYLKLLQKKPVFSIPEKRCDDILDKFKYEIKGNQDGILCSEHQNIVL